MNGPLKWLGETFSADATEDDIVKARSLNVTRMAGVVTPILVGIWTAISEVADKPPFDNTDFQRQLVLAFIGLIALVSTADILGRAIAATKVGTPRAVATLFPTPISATLTGPGKDVAGHVVALRAKDADASGSTGEFLFVEEAGGLSWKASDSIQFD